MGHSQCGNQIYISVNTERLIGKLTVIDPNSLGRALENFSTNFVLVASLAFYKGRVIKNGEIKIIR